MLVTCNVGNRADGCIGQTTSRCLAYGMFFSFLFYHFTNVWHLYIGSSEFSNKCDRQVLQCRKQDTDTGMWPNGAICVIWPKVCFLFVSFIFFTNVCKFLEGLLQWVWIPDVITSEAGDRHWPMVLFFCFIYLCTNVCYLFQYSSIVNANTGCYNAGSRLGGDGCWKSIVFLILSYCRLD